MATTHHTNCVLCPQNCGLEVTVEEDRIVKAMGDKANPRSQGYACRKGLRIAHHQHHADRLKYPLKRVNGRFERISWEQALDEIAARLKEIVQRHGPRSFAYMGGGGQGSHFEAAFGVRLMKGLGSRYHYTALGQEFSGMLWVNGRMFGRQNLDTIADVAGCEVLLAIGWNGMLSHQIPRAPNELLRISKDPEKQLIVVDPRVSETAKIADVHLQIRPGSDALLLKAMIAIVLEEGWVNREYLATNASGFEEIERLFEGFDVAGALRTCRLDEGQVREVTRLFATRRSALRYDLGILMGRHSAVGSWLAVVLEALCGRIGAPGGNVFSGHLVPIVSHSDERDPRTWRTVATDFFPVAGAHPPNAMPEEILSDRPDRLRAVYVSNANPLRSYADTTAYEEAFARLDLLVTAELAMTETAALSHYVLPVRSGYESWDGTFFPFTYPGIFFQMRRPVVAAEGEPLEGGEIHVRLAERLGLIPPIPEALRQAAVKGRMEFAVALMGFVREHPEAIKAIPFVLGKTLGEAMGSVNLAALWGILQTAPRSFRENAARAGFPSGVTMGEAIFQAIIDHPEGLWVGQVDPAKPLDVLKTEDKRIHLHVSELDEEIREIEPGREEIALAPDPAFPLVLSAGRHTVNNANTIMRDPSWLAGQKRPCTVTMHPTDAASLGLTDGQLVRVSTEAGAVEIELETTDAEYVGHVSIPHGFGLVHAGKAYGANVNRLTKNTHRDQFGTPIHRYVPCRVAAIS